MNWVDVTIILLLVAFAWEGFSKSFIGELVYLMSFVLAFFVSLRFYNFMAVVFEDHFQVPHSLANVLGFIFIWFLIEAVIFPISYLVIQRLKFLEQVDLRLRNLAFLAALLRGLIFIAILLILVGTFPIQPKIKQAISDSTLGTLILTKTTQLESPLKTIFGGFGDDTLTFLTIKPKSDQRINLGFSTTNFAEDLALESRMVELVNRERANRGIKVLVVDQDLGKVAAIQSRDMLTRGYFSHYSPEGLSVADRATSLGVSFSVIGENLAYAPSLSLAHNGLMNSPGHRANILSEDFAKIGISIMDAGVYGLMVTQVFSN